MTLTPMKTLSCNEAKKIPINEYLVRMGIKPVYSKGNDLWYLSPLRDEKHPSFKVNTKLNAWYDHGTGEGGSIIDLGIRLHNCSISDLLQKMSADVHLSFQQPPSNTVQNNIVEPKIIIKDVSPIHNFALKSYLRERGVSLQTAKQYCKQVGFSIADKNYSAIGFPNRSGGYELRNRWFKGSSSPKDITFLDNGSKSVFLFEGFIDFLSILELRVYRQLHANFLVLNSVSLLHRSVDVLRSHQDVFLFLNNDLAGKNAAIKLKESGIDGIYSGEFYKEFKDINEYLQATSENQNRGSI
ncbi:toprim domain-containing protein [Solitalea lacus]|uniref:toprim domain-containing protein n=1 Tax=Solitalea lacus TaxID=2911172 RepID=UPI001EDACA8A|nr:toprim domain-containing protein [Solitalea lacus]UKJ07369.1 toprim domain-containing protein [Solitalea lacus]